jgi:threonine/homoserine/homoserine lactone efflux protein
MVIWAAAIEGQAVRARMLGLGGAIAEGLWALGAARGLGLLLESNPRWETLLRAGGGGIALGIGLALAFSRPRAEGARSNASAPGLVTGFLLVALNPSFLAAWLASCALLQGSPRLAGVLSASQAPWLALGAVIGVGCWFSVLVQLIERHREKISLWHRTVVRGLGFVLIALGAAWLLSSVFG